MTPTPKLRFIQRDGPFMGFHKGSDGSETTMHQKIRILQQWWDDDSWKHVNRFDADGKHVSTGEWRDVPLEAE
jgi:hypothetical protein